MSFSEKILEELTDRATRDGIGIFEAASDYCEERDIDPQEFVAQLDRTVLDRLRNDAVNERKVRRCVQEPTATLF